MADETLPAPDADPVVAAVKATHAAGGRPLTRAEAVEFLARPINLGRPRAPVTPPGKRGPKYRRDQYRQAYERRRGLWQRLVSLPRMASAASWLLCVEYLAVLRDVAGNRAIPRRRKVAAVVNALARRGLRAPHPRTVARHLKRAPK